MKVKLIVVAVFVLLCNAHINAHPGGHGKPKAILKEQATEAASEYRGDLIKKGKLDAKWSTAKLKNAEVKRVEYRKSWIVTYSLAEGDFLEITMSESGDFRSMKEYSEKK